MNLKLGSIIVLFSAAMAACGGSNNQEPATASTTSSSNASTTAPAASPTDDGETQAARGAKLYAENCASCHGDHGEGKDAPPVVGKDALPLDPRPTQKFRKNQFHTAADVADFVVHNMPPKKAGTLPESDYWDILAFDLKANGVAVAGKHIDASTAATIQLH